jgi:two-component system, NarL family, nitrate/nitrite response regulator NarL
MNNLKILLVDDDIFLLDGLKRFIKTIPNTLVIGMARDGAEALDRIKQLKPELVFLDIDLPKIDGLKVTEESIRKYPETKIILLTGSKDKEYILKGHKIGAMGYIIKGSTRDTIVEAIDFVRQGKRYFKGFPAEVIIENPLTDSFSLPEKKYAVNAEVTDREFEVLKYVVKGLSDNDIAKELGISVRTVQVHILNINKKFGTHNKAELAVYAIRNNYVMV